MTGLTTAQFQDTASFMTGASGWDFNSVWMPPSSGYYPVLYAMAPVTWVKALSVDTVYGSGSGTVTAIGTQGSLGSYIFGKAGDSLTLTGATIATDSAAAVSATPTTASLPTSNATVTSTKGTDYRVFYYGSTALTVTPAALTVTADAATKTYGDTANLSGYTVTGLKNSDGVTRVSLASTGAASTTSPAGSYAIDRGTLAASPNYSLVFRPGVLTVIDAGETVQPQPPSPESRDPSGPGQSEGLTRILTSAVLPRNLVVVTASQATQPFQGNDAPVLFPSAGTQAASGSASTAAGVSGESSGNSNSQETATDTATCIGGAVASSACTAAPHPENTRSGRFLRFSMP